MSRVGYITLPPPLPPPLLMMLLLLSLLFSAARSSSAKVQLHVSRIGNTETIQNFALLPEGRGHAVQVVLKVGASEKAKETADEYTLEFFGADTEGDGGEAIVSIPGNILRASEVARTADDQFTLLLLPVAPEPVRIVISVGSLV